MNSSDCIMLQCNKTSCCGRIIHTSSEGEKRVKQYQLSFNSAVESAKSFQNLKSQMGVDYSKKLLFQVFSGSMDRKEASDIAMELERVFPKACYVGCSTCGSIVHGDLCKSLYSVTCTVFESPSAMTAVKQYHLETDYADLIYIAAQSMIGFNKRE